MSAVEKRKEKSFKRRSARSGSARGTRRAALSVWVGGDLERASVVALGKVVLRSRTRSRTEGLGDTFVPFVAHRGWKTNSYELHAKRAAVVKFRHPSV